METIEEYKPNYSSVIKAVGLDKTIKNFAELLDYISSRIFVMPKFESYLNGRILNCNGIDASLISLHGIEKLCEIGDGIDAVMLIRKIRDNLFLDLFLISCSEDWDETDVELPQFSELLNDQNLLINVLNEFSLRQTNYEKNNRYKIAVNKWREGKLIDNNDKITKIEFFGFSKYLNFLKSNEVFAECYNKYLKNHFDKLDAFLNDYTHSNSPSKLNNHSYTVNNRLPGLYKQINQCIITLKYLFVVSLYFINSTYFQTEEYENCIEFTNEDPEGLQYNVICDIVDMFEIIKEKDINLHKYLIEHNKYCMKMQYDDYKGGDQNV